MSQIPWLTMVLACAVLDASAQNPLDLYNRGLSLEKQMDEQGALVQFQSLLNLQPDNLKALVQASRLCDLQGKRERSASRRSSWFQQARNYAEKALKTNPNNAGANYVMGLTLENQAPISGAKQMVADYRDMDRFALNALRMDSSYYLAWNLLGRWNLKVQNLNIMERAAANVLFGGMPRSGLDSAIADLEQCRRLRPSFIANYYDLAKALHQDGRDDKAIGVLKRALALRSLQQDDDRIKQECRGMLASLR